MRLGLVEGEEAVQGPSAPMGITPTPSGRW